MAASDKTTSDECGNRRSPDNSDNESVEPIHFVIVRPADYEPHNTEWNDSFMTVDIPNGDNDDDLKELEELEELEELNIDAHSGQLGTADSGNHSESASDEHEKNQRRPSLESIFPESEGNAL